ncbi:MAG: MFS transporter [bacterium]|nr:MFS transporter [bacterium]
MSLPQGTPLLDSPTQPASGAPPAGFQLYAFAVASWFSAWGIQGVLFSWLIVNDLGAPAEWVGAAQFSLVAPGVLLLLGGATADRFDRISLMTGIHIVAAGIVAALALVVLGGKLSFPYVIAYALALGTASSFLHPARDAVLSDVAGSDLPRAVVGTTLIQFVASGGAAFLAGFARYVGSPAMLGVQSAILLVGVVAIRRLPRSSSHTRVDARPRFSDLGTGLVEVLRSRDLLPVFLLVLGVGFFFQGAYFVVYPLLVRDFYQGDVGELGALIGVFPIGVVVGSVLLLRGLSFKRRGRAMAIAQALAACCLLITSLGVPYPLALLAGLGWGLSGSVFLNVGRTIFQERALGANRARVLSVYPLGFFVAGAVGSPAAGLLAGAVGPLGAFAFAGAGMLVFVSAVALTTRISKLE